VIDQAASAAAALALVGGSLARGPGRSPGSRAGARGKPSHGARWATAADVRSLTHPGSGRIRLGEFRSRARCKPLWTERAQSVAVLGPTQSGKTSGFAIPAILGWDGPVLAASVKSDLLAKTERWRAARGMVWCFDPTGSTGRVSSAWSPLPAARTWSGARRVAADLTELAHSHATSADGDFWYATAAKLLAPLLFAAASAERSLRDVARWVDTQEVGEVLELLEAASLDEALWAATAAFGREERQRSSVYTTAETVLDPLLHGATDDGEDIDPERLLDGRNTLYLCAPAHDQRTHRGVFIALIKQVLDTAFRRAARHGPLDPPLLVVLDEAANIAPVAELDVLAATCAGHGIQLVTVWQDLAQVQARYGARAPTVLNNHRAKLFLSGIAEPSTLEYASALVGEREVPVASRTVDGSGLPSTGTSNVWRRLLPPEALRQMPPGSGVLVYGERPPVRLRLVPFWEDAVLAERAG
jgi:type IV secretion system protein VirD4